MTFQPARDTTPPAAATTAADPGEQAVEQIAESVDSARESIQSARERALDDAETQGERDEINAHFNALTESINEQANRIESAIMAGNDRLATTLTGFLDRLDSRLQSTGGAGDVAGIGDEDDDILSVEEIAEGVTDPVTDAAAATGQAIQDVADEAPRRVHRLFRPLFGGNKSAE